jgi:hypothetical protein
MVPRGREGNTLLTLAEISLDKAAPEDAEKLARDALDGLLKEPRIRRRPRTSCWRVPIWRG